MFRRHVVTVLFASLPALAGCAHLVHTNPEDAYAFRPSDLVSEESKSCVFVFMFDPLDPLASANLTGLRDHIQQLGFGKTYYGQPCHLTYFAEKIQWLRERCGDARFAIVGYDAGAEAARQLAIVAAEAGATVDVTIYLEPRRVEPWTPDNTAVSTITIRADELADAESTDCDEPQRVRKSEVPTHPKTYSLVERELTLIAMTVPPPPRPEAKRVMLVPQVASPRSTVPKPKPLPTDWQFLQPKAPWEKPPPRLPASMENLPAPQLMPDSPPAKK